MKRSVSYLVLPFIVVAGLAAIARPAGAQGRLDLEVAAGPAPYDLSGTGTGTSGAAFLAWRKVRGLVIEPGVTFFTYVSQFEQRTSLLLPELSVQGELQLGSFRPFLGGGAGASLGLEGSGETALTLHAVAGTRVDLSQDWGLLGEMRIRAIRPWTGNTVDFLFGFSRGLRRFSGTTHPVPRVRPPPIPPARLEIAGHLGVHVDRTSEADRLLTDGGATMYATSGEASAFSVRLGHWLRPSLGVQLGLSRSSNASWQGSTPIFSEGVPGFANRTTYLSARGVVQTAPVRRAQLFAAAGPALMVHSGTGVNLRTSDVDVGGVFEIGARLRASQWLGFELAVSNYFYSSRYQDEGSVFQHDPLILPGVVLSWR